MIVGPEKKAAGKNTVGKENSGYLGRSQAQSYEAKYIEK